MSPILDLLPGIAYRGGSVEPVFVVGSGRSGTTLLRRVLMVGGQVHIPPESYVIGDVVRRFSTWRLLPWPVAARRVLATFEGYPDFHTWHISTGPVEAMLADTPKEQQSLSTILDALYRFHSSEHGSGTERWGDKTPLNAYFLPEIRRVFPRARFVHMLRDGCDVVASMVEMGRYGTLEEAARRWTSAVAAIERFARQHPSAVLEVRYESLASDPEATLQQVCGWLGVDFAPEMVGQPIDGRSLGDVPALTHHRNVLEPISANSVGRGRTALDESTRRRLQELLGATLAATGYPPLAPTDDER